MVFICKFCGSMIFKNFIVCAFTSSQLLFVAAFLSVKALQVLAIQITFTSCFCHKTRKPFCTFMSVHETYPSPKALTSCDDVFVFAFCQEFATELCSLRCIKHHEEKCHAENCESIVSMGNCVGGLFSPPSYPLFLTLGR